MLQNSRLLSHLRHIRHVSTKQRPFQEVKIPVPWGHISGKWWDPSNQRPILTLHGWQDNCGSFDRLVPLLKDDVGVLAIDLPGHGLSSRLPPGMYYHNMNYPIIIKHICDYFEWPKVTLMGHSLGAISSFVYTMIFPEIVDFLICLDGAQPVYKKNNAPRMATGIQEFLKYEQLNRQNGEPPSYPLELMKQRVAEMNNRSIGIDHCHHILERSVARSKADPGKYYFTRDPRVKSRLILNWPKKDLLEGAYRVTCPTLIVKFTGSGYFDDKETFYEILDALKKSSKDCQYHYVDGSHHTHLNNPEALSNLINDFIQTYNNVQSRDGGGISQDITQLQKNNK